MIHMGIIFYIDDTAWTIWIHHDTPLESWLLPCDHPASHCQAAESRRFSSILPSSQNTAVWKLSKEIVENRWRWLCYGPYKVLAAVICTAIIVCISKMIGSILHGWWKHVKAVWNVNSANSAKKRCWNWSSNAFAILRTSLHCLGSDSDQTAGEKQHITQQNHKQMYLQ